MESCKLGVIGFSQGNGHPYSFSAIINGYNESTFDSDWSVILSYLRNKPKCDYLTHFGASVDSVWTPDACQAKRIADSCYINEVCDSYQEMAGVDGVIIARDDWRERNKIVDFFLDRNIPVFCDKPLTANPIQLKQYEPAIKSGLLYSGSGMRYAIELDPFRKKLKESEFISCYVVNDLERYGIHMLDAVIAAKDQEVRSVTALKSRFSTYEFIFCNDHVMHLTCSSEFTKTFVIQFWCPEHNSVSINDNFSAFRRALLAFLAMIKSGKNPDAEATIRSIRALIQATSL